MKIDKLIKAKIKLQKDSPFFSYICQHFKIIKSEEMNTIGVNGKMELTYNENFINGLEIETIETIIMHEILHVILFHPERTEDFFKKNGYTENPDLFDLMNVSLDMVCNDILVSSNIKIPRKINNHEFIVPEDHECSFMGITIKDINKKTGEKIFLELLKQLKNNPESKENYDGVDDHSKLSEGSTEESQEGKSNSSPTEGNPSSTDKAQKSKFKAGKLKKLEEFKKKLIVEAGEFERMRKGDLPLGLERLVNKIVEPPKINWKAILKNHITSQIPADSTYSRPGRKSIAVGCYLPSIKREGLSVVIIADTSGSISNKDLKEFLAEIIGISKSFNNVTMRLITVDCEVHEDLEIINGNINKIMGMKFKGGGGTSFKIPLDYVKDNYKNTKLVVFLTDGDGDEFNKRDYQFKFIWALTEGGSRHLIEDSGRIVELK